MVEAVEPEEARLLVALAEVELALEPEAMQAFQAVVVTGVAVAVSPELGFGVIDEHRFALDEWTLQPQIARPLSV